MTNIKGFAVASDGSMKRIAITYDVIDDTGKIVKANARANRVVADDTALGYITSLESFVQDIAEGEEE